jgi:hypothetical protein
MFRASVHQRQYKMASDLVTPTAQQSCIITFLVKEKAKRAEGLCSLNEQYGKRTCHMQMFKIGTISFLKDIKKS